MKADKYLALGANEERLYREYYKYGSLTIGFDFDDTVHDFHKTGAKYDMVIELLRELKEIGCKLVCWTAHPDVEYVDKYLVTNNIPFDGINEGEIILPWKSKKPFFSATLDDRAGLESIYRDLSNVVQRIKNDKK